MRLHLHRWRRVGAGGIFATPVRRCRTCGAHKVAHWSGATIIIPPTDTEEADRG